MKTKPIVLSISLLLMSGTAMADDDCNDPVANWQPRENLREKLEAEGWTVHRIKVDDGCYEVKGFDSHGVRAEASFAPASLMMMSWEREEADDDDLDPGKWSGKNGQDNARRQIPGNGIVKGRPTVTVE